MEGVLNAIVQKTKSSKEVNNAVLRGSDISPIKESKHQETTTTLVVPVVHDHHVASQPVWTIEGHISILHGVALYHSDFELLAEFIGPNRDYYQTKCYAFHSFWGLVSNGSSNVDNRTYCYVNIGSLGHYTNYWTVEAYEQFVTIMVKTSPTYREWSNNPWWKKNRSIVRREQQALMNIYNNTAVREEGVNILFDDVNVKILFNDTKRELGDRIYNELLVVHNKTLNKELDIRGAVAQVSRLFRSGNDETSILIANHEIKMRLFDFFQHITQLVLKK